MGDKHSGRLYTGLAISENIGSSCQDGIYYLIIISIMTLLLLNLRFVYLTALLHSFSFADSFVL